MLDKYMVVITGGQEAGVNLHDYLVIAEQIKDPETGEALGRYPNIMVRVDQVFPKFVVAKLVPTRGYYSDSTGVNIGDEVVMAK